ncbi:hypothetical protein Tco_0571816 [Tanacetum coccineum]
MSCSKTHQPINLLLSGLSGERQSFILHAELIRLAALYNSIWQYMCPRLQGAEDEDEDVEEDNENVEEDQDDGYTENFGFDDDEDDYM